MKIKTKFRCVIESSKDGKTIIYNNIYENGIFNIDFAPKKNEEYAILGLDFYTGVNDKNGVEIYENDIISDGKIEVTVKEVKGIHELSHAVGYVASGYDFGDIFDNRDIVVIGNIYNLTK